jgi:hypothetical protein
MEDDGLTLARVPSTLTSWVKRTSSAGSVVSKWPARLFP